jgi:hypothetical protein
LSQFDLTDSTTNVTLLRKRFGIIPHNAAKLLICRKGKMAIVPARMSLSLSDSRGGGGTFLVHALVSDASTIAQAKTAVDDLAAAFNTVSTAGVEVGTFSLLSIGGASDPGADSDISAGAVFDFSNAALVPGTYGLNVPSFLDSLIASDGTIDVGAGASAAFAASILAGVLGGGITDSSYLDLVDILDAFLSSRKRRKRAHA